MPKALAASMQKREAASMSVSRLAPVPQPGTGLTAVTATPTTGAVVAVQGGAARQPDAELVDVGEGLALARLHAGDDAEPGGEVAAASLLARMPGRAAAIRQLAYRLYTLCERKGRAEDARPYNELITSWGAVEAQTPAVIGRAPQKTLTSYGG